MYFSSDARSGPSPMITTRRRVSGAICSRTLLIIFSRCIGRLRGARRMTDTIVIVPSSARVGSGGATCHAVLSMPFGSTITSRASPAIRRIGAAATSLTAENTAFQSRQWKLRSSTANAGVA